MSTLAADLRRALQALLRARGFTAVAVSTLGAGLALGVLVMALVNVYLVRGLPYPESHRLFNIQYNPAAASGPASANRAPRDLEKLDWRSLDDIVELPIAWDLDVWPSS